MCHVCDLLTASQLAPHVQENRVHGDSASGLMSPATNLQNRLKDAKNKFASLRESADA